jgi:hypothetical protein
VVSFAVGLRYMLISNPGWFPVISNFKKQRFWFVSVLGVNFKYPWKELE